VPVAVQILVAGTTRTLTASPPRMEATGHFPAAPNEAGDYSVTAADRASQFPGAGAVYDRRHDRDPATAKVTVVPNTPLTGKFTLTNLSDMTLSGLTATAAAGRRPLPCS